MIPFGFLVVIALIVLIAGAATGWNLIVLGVAGLVLGAAWARDIDRSHDHRR